MFQNVVGLPIHKFEIIVRSLSLPFWRPWAISLHIFSEITLCLFRHIIFHKLIQMSSDDSSSTTSSYEMEFVEDLVMGHSFLDDRFLSHFIRDPCLPSMAFVQAPQTPPPCDEEDEDNTDDLCKKSSSYHRVTPDNRPGSCTLTLNESSLHCLQEKYRQSIRKLAKSMRQSDATRSMIQRQKRQYSCVLEEAADLESSAFFSSNRFMELEASRRKVLKTIVQKTF